MRETRNNTRVRVSAEVAAQEPMMYPSGRLCRAELVRSAWAVTTAPKLAHTSSDCGNMSPPARTVWGGRADLGLIPCAGATAVRAVSGAATRVGCPARLKTMSGRVA